MNSKLNGYFKWIALMLSIAIPVAVTLVNVYSDMRVVEASVIAHEKKVDVQYEAILRELKFIKEMVR